MRSRLLRVVCLWTVLVMVIPAFAQMGYPLKGSWSGDWWVKKGDENHILLEFDWDGKVLKGMLNPGTDNASMTKLSLEPPANVGAKAMDPWLLHFEADVKESSSKTTLLLINRQGRDIFVTVRPANG